MFSFCLFVCLFVCLFGFVVWLSVSVFVLLVCSLLGRRAQGTFGAVKRAAVSQHPNGDVTTKPIIHIGGRANKLTFKL